MIKAIIFDLDGTLIYTLEDLMDSVNYALEKYGYKKISLEETRLNVGNGQRVLIKKSLPENSCDELIDEVGACYTNRYKTHFNIKTKSYEGINEVLEYLQINNIKIGVNTNKFENVAKDLLKQIFPTINFNIIVGEQDGLPHKPDPSGAYKIINELKVNKDEVLYVGDSGVDMQTAANANIKSIGCKWGFRDEKTLKENNATYIIDNPKQIIEIVKEENKQ